MQICELCGKESNVGVFDGTGSAFGEVFVCNECGDNSGLYPVSEVAYPPK